MYSKTLDAYLDLQKMDADPELFFSKSLDALTKNITILFKMRTIFAGIVFMRQEHGIDPTPLFECPYDR